MWASSFQYEDTYIGRRRELGVLRWRELGVLQRREPGVRLWVHARERLVREVVCDHDARIERDEVESADCRRVNVHLYVVCVCISV